MTENIIGLDQQPFFTPALSPISADADAATASRNGTVKAGALAVPINMAIVPSKYGVRASILTGFNLYR